MVEQNKMNSRNQPANIARLSAKQKVVNEVVYARTIDLPRIFEDFATSRRKARDPMAPGKPVMHNLCSKQHPMHNPRLVKRGKIILQTKEDLEAKVMPSKKL